MPATFSFSGLGGKYVVLRHYFKGLVASWVNGATSSFDGHEWRLTGVYTGVTTYQSIFLLPNYVAVSTNRYTPDHMIEDYYYVNEPSPTHINPLPINVQVHIQPTTLDYYLSIDSLGFPDLYYLELPQPTPKWP